MVNSVANKIRQYQELPGGVGAATARQHFLEQSGLLNELQQAIQMLEAGEMTERQPNPYTLGPIRKKERLAGLTCVLLWRLRRSLRRVRPTTHETGELSDSTLRRSGWRLGPLERPAARRIPVPWPPCMNAVSEIRFLAGCVVQHVIHGETTEFPRHESVQEQARIECRYSTRPLVFIWPPAIPRTWACSSIKSFVSVSGQL